MDKHTRPGFRVITPSGTIGACVVSGAKAFAVTAGHVVEAAPTTSVQAIDGGTGALIEIAGVDSTVDANDDVGFIRLPDDCVAHGTPVGTTSTPRLADPCEIKTGERLLLYSGARGGWVVAVVSSSVTGSVFTLTIDPRTDPAVAAQVTQDTSITSLIGGDSGSPIYVWSVVNGTSLRLSLAGIAVQADGSGDVEAVYPGPAFSAFNASLEGA